MAEQFRQAGSRVRDYQIGEMLGVGGFGITYEACHIHLGRHFAIKEYFPAGAARRHADGSVGPLTEAAKAEQFDKGLDRFLREARTLAAISHPNVVQVRDVFVEGGTGYMVMDFVDGETLEATVLRQGAMAPQAVRHLLDRLSDGLGHVHEAGFLHRDIKPSNILIRAHDREPVLIDFGAAKSLQARTGATTQFISHGYSPLEISATRLDSGPWTDLYGLCAVAWFALKGSPPPDAMAERFSAEEDPLERLAAQGGPWVQLYSAIDAGLALYPKDRPQTLQSLREAFAGTETRMVDQAEIAALNAAVARQPAPSPPPASLRVPEPVAVGFEEQVEWEESGKPDLLSRFPTSILGALLMAGVMAAFFLSARLADPTPDYGWFDLAGVIAVAGGIIGLLTFGLDRAVQWLGRKLGRLAWWGKGLHFLLTPAVAVVGMVIALVALAIWVVGDPFSGFNLAIGGALDSVDGDDSMLDMGLVVFLLLAPFAALPLAYWLSGHERRRWWQALGALVGVPALCSFVVPLASVDEAEGLERLGRMGYFVNTEFLGVTEGSPEAVSAFNAAAISAYQQAEGLGVTGTMTGETWRSLLLSWPNPEFHIDPANGRGALEIFLALRHCRPSCSITLGAGEIDLADFGPEYNDAFYPDAAEDIFTDFAYSATPFTMADIEITGTGNGTIITNGTWQTAHNQRIANVMFRNAQLEATAGAHLTNVTIEAAAGMPALATDETGYYEGPLTLDRVTLVTTGDRPALQIFAPEEEEEGDEPRDRHPVTLTDSRFTRSGGGSAPAVRIGGPYAITMTGGTITSDSSPFMELADGVIATVDGVDGACLAALSRAEVTIRQANLTQCGGSGAVIRARSGATVYIEDDTTLPDLPDEQRFDASNAEILMR